MLVLVCNNDPNLWHLFTTENKQKLFSVTDVCKWPLSHEIFNSCPLYIHYCLLEVNMTHKNCIYTFNLSCITFSLSDKQWVKILIHPLWNLLLDTWDEDLQWHNPLAWSILHSVSVILVSCTECFEHGSYTEIITTSHPKWS